MALTETQQTKASVKINHVPTDVDVQTLFNNGSFNPGEIIVTPDEDVNLSQMRMSILWINPNPTSAFSAQTITLSSNDYDFLLTFYYSNTTDKIVLSTICERGDKFELSRAVAYASGYYTLNGNRNCDWVSDTQYNVGNANVAWINQSGNVERLAPNNGDLIPVSIYGIKKSPAMIYTGKELNAGYGVTLDNGTVAVTDKVLGVPSNNNWIDVSVVNNSNVIYTAPANGYLMVQGAAASTSMCRVLLFNVTNSANDVFDAINGQGCYAYNSDNTMMGTTICKKGDVVKIYITNLKDIRARFVPSEV